MFPNFLVHKRWNVLRKKQSISSWKNAPAIVWVPEVPLNRFRNSAPQQLITSKSTYKHLRISKWQTFRTNITFYNFSFGNSSVLQQKLLAQAQKGPPTYQFYSPFSTCTSTLTSCTSINSIFTSADGVKNISRKLWLIICRPLVQVVWNFVQLSRTKKQSRDSSFPWRPVVPSSSEVLSPASKLDPHESPWISPDSQRGNRKNHTLKNIYSSIFIFNQWFIVNNSYQKLGGDTGMKKSRKERNILYLWCKAQTWELPEVQEHSMLLRACVE